MAVMWNMWHGCRRISEGCRLCYVYRQDSKWQKDSSAVARTAQFDLPVRRDRRGRFKIASGTVVYACMTSDFFIEEADAWRPEAWEMMRLRHDLNFIIITKRIHRTAECLPPDWGEGYDNVWICSTCETQERANFRLPILLSLPARHKSVICEPLIEPLDLSAYLPHGIESLYVGGESGEGARVCDYAWVESLRRQCDEAGVGFHFHQTGARFLKEGRLYRIPRRHQHSQARKAGLDTV